MGYWTIRQLLLRVADPRSLHRLGLLTSAKYSTLSDLKKMIFVEIFSHTCAAARNALATFSYNRKYEVLNWLAVAIDRWKNNILIDHDVELVARPDPNRRRNVQILRDRLFRYPAE